MSEYMNEIRLKHAASLLIGKICVCDNGKNFVLDEVGFKWCTLSQENDSSMKRRIRVKETINTYLKLDSASANTKRVNIVNKFVSDFAAFNTEARNAIEASEARIQVEKTLQGKLNDKITKHKKQQRESGGLESDHHTLPSLLSKMESSKNREQQHIRSLNELRKANEWCFSGPTSICKFFAINFDIKLVVSTVMRWMKGTRMQGNGGRPTYFEPEVELEIVKMVIFYDDLGFPMNRKQIISLAEMVLKRIKPDVQRNLSNDWYKGWFRRTQLQNPKLCESLTKTSGNHTVKWFNKYNVNWWFDKITELAFKYQFARESEDGEEGEFVWLNPERVVITDETCISGGNLRSRQSKAKVVTRTNKLETNEYGNCAKRRVSGNHDHQEHITLVGGHNLAGEPTLPIFIFSAKTQISDDQREKINDVFEEREPSSFNGQMIGHPITGVSPKGGITSANITSVMIPAFERMFPDVAPEDGKRVLWLTDWHSSRLCPDLILQLREKGIVLACWLPNCTSLMQSPDVVQFAKFKELLWGLKIDHWQSISSGGKIDRSRIVKFALEALPKAFSKRNCLLGARITGMLPVNRKVLLNNPRIQDGDIKRSIYVKQNGARLIKRHIHGNSIMEPNETNYLNGEILNFDSDSRLTNDFEDDARSAYTSIGDGIPSTLGGYNDWLGKEPNEHSFNEARAEIVLQVNNLYENINELEVTRRPLLEDDLCARGIEIRSELKRKRQERNELRNRMDELEQSLVEHEASILELRAQKKRHDLFKVHKLKHFSDAMRIEKASYRKLGDNLEKMQFSQTTVQQLANIGEKIEHMAVSLRDTYGLPTTDAHAIEKPEFDAHCEFSEILNKYSDHVLIRSNQVSHKKQKNKKNITNTAPKMYAGCLMSRTSSCEITGNRIMDEVLNYNKKK